MYSIMCNVFDRLYLIEMMMYLIEILLVLSFCSGSKDYHCFSGIHTDSFHDAVFSLSSSFFKENGRVYFVGFTFATSHLVTLYIESLQKKSPNLPTKKKSPPVLAALSVT